MDIATKSAFRTVGPVTISTGFEDNGRRAIVDVAIRVDRLGPGEHAEDMMFELANLLVSHLEKRYHPTRK